MNIIQFKCVAPGQEFVLCRSNSEYVGGVDCAVCIATNDGIGVSYHDGSLIDMNSEEYVIVEEEEKMSERKDL